MLGFRLRDLYLPVMDIIATTITGVTLFPDQAEVLRTGSLDGSAGVHEWTLGPFSRHLKRDSLQVQLRGNGTLLEVSVIKPTSGPELDSQASQLQAELVTLRAEKAELNGKLAGHERRVKLMESLLNPAQQTGDQPAASFLPDQWEQILDFHDAEHTRYQAAKRELGEQMRVLNEKIQAIEEVLGRPAKKAKNLPYAVKIRVEHGGDESVQCELSYHISGASWRPGYDIRVDTDSQKAILRYQAWVDQRTGEDWTDVQLGLSTAQPSAGGKIPTLSPVFLRRYTPPPPRPQAKPVMAKRSASKKLTRSAPAAEMSLDIAEAAAPAPSARPQAKVSEQATAVQFDIEALQSIPSGGEGQQVFILEEEVGLELAYKTVPALKKKAFLRAQLHNTLGVPMLAGEANVFMDDRFVASQALKMVAPQDKFWCSLGIDSGIKVEAEFVKGKRSSEGFLGPKKDKYVQEHIMKLTNFKSKPVRIEVQARYPVSQDEDIKVELIEPKYQEDTELLKRDEKNRLSWNLMLDPQVERQLTLAYSVTHPKGMRLDQWS